MHLLYTLYFFQCTLCIVSYKFYASSINHLWIFQIITPWYSKQIQNSMTPQTDIVTNTAGISIITINKTKRREHELSGDCLPTSCEASAVQANSVLHHMGAWLGLFTNALQFEK